jgi:hypothetical protein
LLLVKVADGWMDGKMQTGRTDLSAARLGKYRGFDAEDTRKATHSRPSFLPSKGEGTKKEMPASLMRGRTILC